MTWFLRRGTGGEGGRSSPPFVARDWLGINRTILKIDGRGTRLLRDRSEPAQGMNVLKCSNGPAID